MIRYLSSALVAIVVFGIAMASTTVLAAQVRQEQQLGGYRFRNVRISPNEGSPDRPGQPIDVTVAYEIAWEGDEFPGLQNCTAIALDSDGGTIAEKAFDLYSLTRDFVPIHTELALPFPSEKPSDVRVDCVSGASDMGGRWEFQNINVRRDPTGAFGEATFHFVADLVWTGTGAPMPQECLARVMAGGATLFEQPFGMFSAEGQRPGVAFDLSGPSGDSQPESATIECSDVQ